MKQGRKFSMITILTVSTALVVALIVTISSAVLYGTMRENLRERTAASYEQLFQQTDAQLTAAFQDIIRMSAALNADSELVGAVNLAMRSEDTAERLKSERYAQYILKCALGYHSYIDNVGIYIGDRQFLMNETDSLDYHTRIPNDPWFRQLLTGERDSVLISNYEIKRTFLIGDSAYYKKFCIYAMRFNDTLMARSTGVLLISISQEYIESFLNTIDGSGGQIIALLDENGGSVYCNDNEAMALLEPSGEWLASATSNETLTLNGTDYFFIHQKNSFSGWYLVALIPTKVLYRDIGTLQAMVVASASVALLVGVWLSALISRSITNPFKTLLESMSRAGKGDMTQLANHSYIQEVDKLMKGYDTMLGRIKNLIGLITQIEGQKRQAELAALQAQINPHFTYNTLDSIRWMAMMQGAPKAAEMISSFVKLLQLTTGKAKDFITVAEEMDQIACYVDIMKFRYNSRIVVRFHQEAAVRGCRTLKLILQPMVENSFVHGFRNFELPGVIEIEAKAQDGCLVFEIRDDGEGAELAEGTLPETAGNTGASLHRGIGVSNVNERIRMWFGEDYGVRFLSEKGKGTVVEITQPLVTMEGEDTDDSSADCGG